MTIALWTAFVGGLVSFLAPCVLPIIPGFLAYLAGSSTTAPKRRDIFLSSVFFVLGFSVVFALIGVVLNTVLVGVASSLQIWLSRFGGTLIIFFGLYLTGLLKISYFDREYKFRVSQKIGSRPVTSFLFGLAFAAGWTPCVGPVLGVILGLAASAPGTAFILLLAYSLGLGLPFILVGLFTAQASVLIERYAGVLSIVNKVFGAILILLGILVFTGTLAQVANFDFVSNVILK
ncbi:MAG: cytochrome c biogenesis protein CcdA [Patescibacteria group bacterium]